MTDTFKMVLSYYDMTCTPASIAPVVDIGACVAMKATVSTCHLPFILFLPNRILPLLYFRFKGVKSG
jgi:hypothetical protein